MPSALAAELGAFVEEIGEVTTVLTGPIGDSAALYGLLARLEALGIALVGIRPVTNEHGDDLR